VNRAAGPLSFLLRPGGVALGFWCAFLLLCAADPTPARCQQRELLERTLRDHGVDTTPLGLASFLDKGWDGARPPGVLPREPGYKSSLLIESWQLLALRYKDVTAQPSVQAAVALLARRYATGEFPPAVDQLLEKDLESVEGGKRPAERALKLKFQQYNGMIALGLFGRPSPDTLKEARRVFDAETDPLVRVMYAQTVALLGDASVLDFLVQEITKGNTTSSVAAAAALSVLTGQTLELRPVMAAEPRREAAMRIVAWWMSEDRSAMTIDREAALRRLLRPPAAAPRSLRTLRDVLRASADITDVADKRGSRTAWNQLEAMGTALPKQLEPILNDPREDLDIRSEAIRWYARLKGKDARSELRRLRRDANPEIAKLAKELLATPLEGKPKL
jgi:hypothetical protein